jgi:hypothetical protein
VLWIIAVEISPIALKMPPGKRVLSAMPFHEKTGWSQVDSFWFSWFTVFLPEPATVATLPSALSMSVFCSLGAS